MTLDEIINFFERVEKGEMEGVSIGFHLHEPIHYVEKLVYGSCGDKHFSDFLWALKDYEPIPSAEKFTDVEQTQGSSNRTV